MDKQEKEKYVYRVFQNISNNYDGANRRISIGLQKSWKKQLIDHLTHNTKKNAYVLDVCCGTGDIAIETAKKRQDLHVTGIDFSPAMLRVASRKGHGIRNVHFMQGNALNLPYKDNTFSAVCISFGLRNTADYTQVIKEMRRVTKPGGCVYCLDSFVPESPLIRPFYQIYFHYIMPTLGGGSRYKKEYRWLYQSTQEFLHRKELEQLYLREGLTQIKHKNKMFGACVLVWGKKQH